MVWGLGVTREDDLDEVADPVAVLLWLWSSSNIDTRSFLSFLELLFMPLDELKAKIHRSFKVVSSFKLIFLILRNWKPRQRAVLVVFTGQDSPSEVSP